jgi:hypothetical protein
VFICVKNNIACSELWVDDEFEIRAVVIKGSDPRCTWEILGIYRATNEDIRVIETLAARTGFQGNSTKRSIIGGDLNLPQVDWKGIAEGGSVAEAFINRLVWDKGYTQWWENRHEGIRYWTFTSYDPKVHSYLAVFMWNGQKKVL